MMKGFSKKTEKKLLEKIRPMIQDERWQRFNDVLNMRTRMITLVLEDIYQTQNASAVIRTCELMGIQDIHIVEKDNTYQLNPDIVVGANKWITMIKYNKPNENNLIQCYKNLKKKGYKILAMSPHKQDVSLSEFEVKEKTALLFGNEGIGLSEEAMNLADGFVKIPMAGFTESYNLSVSAAITLYQTTRNLRNTDLPWQLNPSEKETLLLDYALKTIRNPEMVVKTILKEESQKNK